MLPRLGRLLFFMTLLHLPLSAGAVVAFSPAVQGGAIRPGADWDQRKVVYRRAEQGVDLFVALDQQQYPMLRPFIEQYAREHGLNIRIASGNCGVSAGLLRRKQVDIGGYCCPPGRLDRLAGLRFHTMGIMGIAIIANPRVPVDDISLAQARRIFDGEIDDWKALAQGGGHALISPVIRPHCRKRPGHWRLLLDRRQDFSREAIEVGAIEDMLLYVAKRDYAVGYEVPWMIDTKGQGLKLKLLRIDGVSPRDEQALARHEYPLYRVLNMTTWEDAAHRDQAEALVRWLLGRIKEDNRYGLVTADELRAHGWRFDGDELIGPPPSGAARQRPRDGE